MTQDVEDELVRKALKNIKIPPAPHVLDKLHKELQKDEPALEAVAEILAQDIGLSALVLRSVNSPYFGLRTKAVSIQHATSLFGLRNIVNIVAGLALRRVFEEVEGANPPNFWDSPLNVAMAAAAIARAVFYSRPDEAYMLGLFHNAGHPLLTQHFAGYAEFMSQHINAADQSICAAEDRQYQVEHAVLGYYLARAWGLDKRIANVIRDHHQVKERFAAGDRGDPSELSLLAILKMAEHIDKLFWGYQPDYEWLEIQDLILNFVGLSEQDFAELHQDIADNVLGGLTR
ncbi:hypothetical protein A1507_15685 [Methylomonas koyamae]|uniref:HDOD domain-containing protein n=1 Tax=Methylomonas koyamae TaxID=702114 RepID=A0A177NA70_9GAMM|nr:HDOD domain-containing protein [Methylomonas koyamae]OAI14119.1 hypothetical protein A1507_15685 [Methylomonas koyamae]